MNWRIFVVLFICISANANVPKKANNLHKMDFMKRKQTLFKFKQQLLTSLSVPPAFSIDDSPKHKWMQLPKYIRKRLIMSNANIDHARVETKEIFVPVKIARQCLVTNLTEPHICINFHLDQATLDLSTNSAILYLDLPRLPRPLSSYHIKQDHYHTNGTLELTHLNGNLLEVNIIKWIKNDDNDINNKIHQFVIICSGECKNETYEDAQLFLEVSFGTKSRDRSKRSVDDSLRTCGQNEIMCCKGSFVFRPIDIGWNWIVHPEEIRLNYCMGECNDQTSNYTYSRVLSLLKRSKNANLTPQQLESMKFCCAPKSYSGLEVVYLTSTNNSFQKIHLNNMIVNTCACV